MARRARSELEHSFRTQRACLGCSVMRQKRVAAVPAIAQSEASGTPPDTPSALPLTTTHLSPTPSASKGPNQVQRNFDPQTRRDSVYTRRTTSAIAKDGLQTRSLASKCTKLRKSHLRDRSARAKASARDSGGCHRVGRTHELPQPLITSSAEIQPTQSQHGAFHAHEHVHRQAVDLRSGARPVAAPRRRVRRAADGRGARADDA